MIELIKVPVIKVLHCNTINKQNANSEKDASENIINNLNNSIKEFSNNAIAILLDSKIPGSASGGGTGIVFDWDIADQLNIPILLAGGLNENNVLEALKKKNVVGVDVSSGVEVDKTPGIKDQSLMSRFITNAIQGTVV